MQLWLVQRFEDANSIAWKCQFPRKGIENGWEIKLLPRLGLVRWVQRFRPPNHAATSVTALVVLLLFPSHGMEYRR